MSEEFFKIAKKELKEDINGISLILENCDNDSDIAKNAEDIEKHLHKIKGLAPMMNQKEIGEISASLDNIFKRIIDQGSIEKSYDAITEAVNVFANVLENDIGQVEKLKKLIAGL